MASDQDDRASEEIGAMVCGEYDPQTRAQSGVTGQRSCLAKVVEGVGDSFDAGVNVGRRHFSSVAQ